MIVNYQLISEPQKILNASFQIPDLIGGLMGPTPRYTEPLIVHPFWGVFFFLL